MTGIELLYLLVFPGLLFTGTVGLLVGWVDRKVSARLQYRVGPPLLQNFNDLAKLMGKEALVVGDGVRPVFIGAPIVALSVVVLVATMVGTALFIGAGFGGDVFVVMYLLMVYSVAIVLGGAASGNVYASVGGGREAKLLLADELPLLLVFLVVIVKAGYTLELTSIIAVQQSTGAFVGSVSGVLAFIVGLLAVQAKMALPPFHIAEAETELVEGPFMEYSGPPLAFWKLAQHMLWVVLPLLLVLLLLGGFDLQGWGVAAALGKYLLVVVLMIVIKNTNPRIRIDTAIRFFWYWATPVAAAALVLAVLGV